MTKLLTEDEQFKVRPSDIPAGHFRDAFGNVETEFSARYIVTLCQERGNWHPFTRDDIEAVYSKFWSHGYSFNRLIPRWIVKLGERYFITEEFVKRCYVSADGVY